MENAICAGKDARHLWFSLKAWRGQEPEDFFSGLGAWADGRMVELGLKSDSEINREEK